MQDDGDNDAALVKAFRAGDREAFARLIVRHRGRVVALAATVLGDAAGAEDVAQEASYQAYFEIERLREPSRFASWLCGIAVNLAKMSLRSSRPVLPLDEAAGIASGANFTDPHLAYESRELEQRVRRAVSELPPEMRDAVWLHYVEGMSYEEASAATGASAGSLRVASHRARRRLRGELAGEWAARRVPRRLGVEVSVELWMRARQDGKFDPVIRFPRWVVFLKSKESERAINIFIGPNEFDAMAMQQAGLVMPRPQTYSFVSRLLEGVNARVERVTVADLVDDVFLATVVLTTGRGTLDIDARPSDALNLALSTNAPIFVADALMERLGFDYAELQTRLEAWITDPDPEVTWLPGPETVRQVYESRTAAARPRVNDWRIKQGLPPA